MPRPVGERPGHERSDQLKATSLQLRLKRVRVGRQEPPIAQLGPCVAGRSHLIEHLAVEDLFSLIRETVRVLRSGGVAIFETPNPANLTVGATYEFHITYAAGVARATYTLRVTHMN